MAVGDESCGLQGGPLRLQEEDVDRGDVFADFKGQGFDLESTRLRRFGKLSRLTLAVAMLYVWLVA